MRNPSSDPTPAAASTPELSVLVPTYGRPERIRNLVAHLARQTLAPERFEVIVVDDGTQPPIALEARTPYALALHTQANAGPGAARNRALAHARAPLCLILNDDVVPADDLLEGHLAAHTALARAGDENVAVLGTFHFTEAARANAFTQLLDESDLLFDFSSLVHGRFHGWAYFWTCNISLATDALRAVGGFDAANFYDIVEDCELGYRLEQRGLRVLYREDLVAHHDHVLSPHGFFERTFRLGRNLAKMHAKHGDARILRQPTGTAIDATVLRQCQATYETLADKVAAVETTLARIESDARERSSASKIGARLAPELVAKLAHAVARVNAAPFCRGILAEKNCFDPEPVRQHGAPTGKLTSVIVVSHDALDVTRRSLAALRAARDESHPIELLYVDNGSRDGSAEYLAAQPDVLLIANEANAGAPRARNQALARAHGEWIVFLDNDAFVTPGWLARLLYHGEIDPRAGCIGPVSDRAAHGQAIAYGGTSDAAQLAAFAERIARERRREFKFAGLLSSYCLLVRRSVADLLGGFDERFTPWGFEDDDYTLRAALLGYHNRIALDVFVRHEAYAGVKLAAHTELLERNWRRFRTKWLLASDAARGDYSGLGELLSRTLPASQLHLPLDQRALDLSFTGS